MWLKIDRRLILFLFASLVTHIVVIILCPGLTPLSDNMPVPLAHVTLIDEGIERPGTKIDDRRNKKLPQEAKTGSDDALKEGGAITRGIAENLSASPVIKDSIPVPPVELPKQVFTPDTREYVKVWPEELSETAKMEIGKFPIPQGTKGDRRAYIPANTTGAMPPLFKDDFPGEIPSQPELLPDITWKGEPRKWTRKPDKTPTYSGEVEGLVKIRFWVNTAGEVTDAIPVQKLSPELEQKALDYIFSWRFETVTGSGLQEGEIRINFELDRSKGQFLD